MRAGQLTLPGFYWYECSEGWRVVWFDGPEDAEPFTFTGNETPYAPAELPGHFVGPIEHPEPVASCH